MVRVTSKSSLGKASNKANSEIPSSLHACQIISRGIPRETRKISCRREPSVRSFGKLPDSASLKAINKRATLRRPADIRRLGGSGCSIDDKERSYLVMSTVIRFHAMMILVGACRASFIFG